MWQLAGGSVIGRRHRATGRNNQDAFCWRQTPDATVAVVCDGCGSGASSEVGAGLGARLVCASLLRQLERAADETLDAEILLERTRRDLLKRLRTLTLAMGGAQMLGDCLLFTVVGALITSRDAVFFALGDGALWVNGEVMTLGPYADNAPPYLAYALLETGFAPEQLRFEIVRRLPVNELQSFLLGSDGVLDLARAQGCKLPGREAFVAPISEFWGSPRVFANADSVRRTLASAARDATVRTRNTDGDCQERVETGLLPDDTTLIVGRRATDS